MSTETNLKFGEAMMQVMRLAQNAVRLHKSDPTFAIEDLKEIIMLASTAQKDLQNGL